MMPGVGSGGSKKQSRVLGCGVRFRVQGLGLGWLRYMIWVECRASTGLALGVGLLWDLRFSVPGVRVEVVGFDLEV